MFQFSQADPCLALHAFSSSQLQQLSRKASDVLKTRQRMSIMALSVEVGREALRLVYAFELRRSEILKETNIDHTDLQAIFQLLIIISRTLSAFNPKRGCRF